MTDSTPTQPEAMTKTDTTYTEGVKVQVKEGASNSFDLPLTSKTAHYLAVVVSGVIALFVSAVLADGASVIKLKPARYLPRLTNPDLISKGLDYRADELLGPGYGVGLHHDSAGFSWNEAGAGHTLQTYIDELGLLQTIAAVPSVIATDGLKHPAYFLACHELKASGLAAMSLGYIAEVVAALMIIFHGLQILGVLPSLVNSKITKGFAALIWFTLTAGFLIVVCIAIGVFETEYTCVNEFVPKVTLSDHFDIQYGVAFGYAGFVSSLLILVAMLFLTSTQDGHVEPPPLELKKLPLGKILASLVTGLVVCIVCSFAVAGSQDAFVDTPVDESINMCSGQKPYSAGPGDKYFKDVDCLKDGVVQVLEQAGANVTKGYVGGMDAGTWRVPITKKYSDTDLCPVNVHWHLGAEHLSVGEFDESFDDRGPKEPYSNKTRSQRRRELAANATEPHAKGDEKEYLDGDQYERLGFRCKHYDAEDPMYTTEYDWEHCTQMVIGETYEVHWPHSAAGACGTKWQYQSPFYDGVFCNDGIVNILTPLNTYETIGVQGQIFTIVNDGKGEDSPYHIDDLFHGMHVGGDFGTDMAYYTGSTTGTSRNNEVCSRYAPITWQVDRKCHIVSASSFDTMCKKMKQQADDMSGDLHPHGAREVSAWEYVANNQQRA